MLNRPYDLADEKKFDPIGALNALKDALGLDALGFNNSSNDEIVQLAEAVCAAEFAHEQLLRESELISGPEVNTVLRESGSSDVNLKALELCAHGLDEKEAAEFKNKIEEKLKYLRKCQQIAEAKAKAIADDVKVSEDDLESLIGTPHEDHWLATKITEKAGLFTSVRLFNVRLNRILNLYGDGYMVNRTIYGLPSAHPLNLFTTHISTVSKILSLSYFLEFATDISMMARAVLFASAAEKKHTPSAWKRLSNSYHTGTRPTRLWNTRWAFINMLDLMKIAPYVSPIANIVGFMSDLAEDVGKYFYWRRTYNKRLAAIAPVLKSFEEKLKQDPDNNELLLQQAMWQRIDARTREAKKAKLHNQLRLVAVSAAILVGTAAYLTMQIILPVLVPALAPLMLTTRFFDLRLAASFLALSGSIFGGAGWRLRAEYLRRNKPKPIEFDEKAIKIDENIVNVTQQPKKILDMGLSPYQLSRASSDESMCSSTDSTPLSSNILEDPAEPTDIPPEITEQPIAAQMQRVASMEELKQEPTLGWEGENKNLATHAKIHQALAAVRRKSEVSALAVLTDAEAGLNTVDLYLAAHEVRNPSSPVANRLKPHSLLFSGSKPSLSRAPSSPEDILRQSSRDGALVLG